MTIDIKNFSIPQKKQIEFGLTTLSEEKVMLYAKKEYNELQMLEIRMALEFGLKEKDLKKILDPTLSPCLMRIIRTNTERYGKDEAFYTDIDLKYSTKVANLIKRELDNGSINKADVAFLNPKYTIFQATAIIDAIKNNFSKEQIELIGGLDLNERDMATLVGAIKKEYPEELLKIARETYGKKMSMVFNAYDNKVDIDTIKFISEKRYSSTFAELVFDFSKEYSKEELVQLLDIVSDNVDNYEDKIITGKYYAAERISVYDKDQLYAILGAIQDGLNKENIKLFAHPEYSPRQMDFIKRIIQKDGPKAATIFLNPALTLVKMKALKELIASEKYSDEQINYFKFADDAKLELVRKSFDYNLSCDEINIVLGEDKNDNFNEKEAIGMIYLFTRENIQKKFGPFSADTMDLIDKGLNFDFSYEDILLFANKELDYQKQKEIILCLIDEVPIKDSFAKPLSEISLEEIKEFHQQYNTASYELNSLMNENKVNLTSKANDDKAL